MYYKGLKFRRNNKIVTLPLKKRVGLNKNTNILFGRVCKEDVKGAVKTEWTYKNGDTVYALPIPAEVYTHYYFMYGKDGKAYFFYDGKCFVAALTEDESVFVAS